MRISLFSGKINGISYSKGCLIFKIRELFSHDRLIDLTSGDFMLV